jgi:hypothetical protein
MDAFGLGLAVLAALALLLEPSEWLTLTADLDATEMLVDMPRYTHNSGTGGYWADDRRLFPNRVTSELPVIRPERYGDATYG